MKDLLHALKFLVFDLASTLFFFGLYSATHNVALSVIASLALAFGQIGWEFAHGKSVDALQWVSLAAVSAGGLGTLHTGNPLYVMLQPSALYGLAGVAMLQRGWMNRYLPQPALEYLPDLGIAFGYVWAGLMFVSAAVNMGLALTLDLKSWSVAIAVWGLFSKAALIVIQVAVMKSAGRQRRRARLAAVSAGIA
jgi:intracellular septation protein